MKFGRVFHPLVVSIEQEFWSKTSLQAFKPKINFDKVYFYNMMYVYEFVCYLYYAQIYLNPYLGTEPEFTC